MAWTEEEYRAFLNRRGEVSCAALISGAKPSKHRNVKVQVDGYTFDSKREAQHYQDLKYRQMAGEISNLRLQVSYPLYCPCLIDGVSNGQHAQIAEYRADFVYTENGEDVVVDAKGQRLPLYRLKAKWMNLQYGIVIKEV